MLLKHVDICNFRSIADSSIDFQPRCRILVGINEAGKTNILKALRLLDPKVKVVPEDIREFRAEENPNQDAFVRFVFNTDGEQRSEAINVAMQKVLSPSLAPKIVSEEGRQLTLADFSQRRSEVFYRVNLRLNERIMTVWTLPASLQILPGWMKPSANCPKDATVSLPNGKSAIIVNYLLIAPEVAEGIPANYLEPADLKPISDLYDTTIRQSAIKALPVCMYWSYEDANLLPGQIPVDPFAANPNSCVPLRCMFQLARIDDITAAIAEAKAKSNGMRNLLKRVSDQSTKHMHTVWKEYKNLTLSLLLNGTNIDAVIQDKHNAYDLTRRSDGFKRFITFLLLISARVASDELKDVLYLHDEPDTSLHPSGARHLRDELLKISQKNYVVYSTHSIFMIDTKSMDRHLIVKKNDEVTTVNVPEHSDIMEEEVLYNAIGYSIFENLKPTNIIFEGWRDKELFEVALARFPSKYKQLKSLFADVGRCHAKGVKDVGRISAMLELAKRKYIVVSDGDKVARERQSAFHGEGEWKRYDELLPSSGVVTMEDFLLDDTFIEPLAEARIDNPVLPEFQMEALKDSRGKLATIGAWMASASMDSGQIKRALDKVKEYVTQSLKPNHIKDQYWEILNLMAVRIQKMREDDE